MPDTAGLPAVMRAHEVAEIFGVSVDTIYELTRQGRLPVLRLGRSFRYSRAVIAALIEAGSFG